MNLLAEDIEEFGHILARRYFTEQGWKFTDLANSGSKIIASLDSVNDQYNKYPYMNKDWYVENSVEKNIHMTTKWDDLSKLVGFLQNWPEAFDFLFRFNNSRSLCIVKTQPADLDSEQQRAIADARKAGFNVYIFKAEIPENMDFELEEVIGGISGVGNFR
ncbi:MAG: hypothetical protein P1P80_04125 [ANME-2 cluster archaeon]|nr:hypothetical protein [ANME-2 cluster archaeon]